MFGKKRKGEKVVAPKETGNPPADKSKSEQEDFDSKWAQENTVEDLPEKETSNDTPDRDASTAEPDTTPEPKQASSDTDEDMAEPEQSDDESEEFTPENTVGTQLVETEEKTSFLDTIIKGNEDIYIPPNMDVDIIRSVDPILEIIHPLVMDEVNITSISKMTTDAIINYMRPIIRRVLEDQKVTLTIDEQDYFENRMLSDITGLGVLDFFLADETVSDILINGCNNIFCERFGRLERSAVNFRDNEQVMNIINKIVSAVGRRCDETVPYVDARLTDGSRFNAIIPPLAIDGPSISIRKFKKDKIHLVDMIRIGSMTEDMAKLLSAAIQSRLNVLVVGGTGAGKTTLLNALSAMIDPRERVVTIEDAAELQLQQPHVVRLETRNANIEGKGEITQRHLVKNALRMRPDRVILGEIRGSEAFDMIQAMNTGHDGSMCTIHASSPREVPARLSNMVMMSGYDFPAKAVMQQVASSINVLVQISRQRDGKRRVTEITEVVGLEGEVLTMQDLFTFEYEREDAMGNIIGTYKCSDIMPHFYTKAEMAGVEHLLKEIYHE